MKGIVKWFNDSKGYGFIIYDDVKEDIFVHYTSILSDHEHKSLIPGEFVEFELVKTLEGYKAKNVKSIKD